MYTNFDYFFTVKIQKGTAAEDGFKTATSLESLAALPCENYNDYKYNFTAQLIQTKVMQSLI